MFEYRGTEIHIDGKHCASMPSIGEAQSAVAWAQIGYQRGVGDGMQRLAPLIHQLATLSAQFTNHSPERAAQSGANSSPLARSGEQSAADRGDPAGSRPSEPSVAVGGHLHAVEGGRVASLIGEQIDTYVGDEWRGTRSVEPETNPCEPTAYHAIEPLPGAPKPLLGALVLAGCVGVVVLLAACVIVPFF